MNIQVNKYAYKDEHDYCEIELSNDNGMKVDLLNYGATLEKVLVPTSNGLRNVIMSLDQPADYSKERNFLGGTIGRIVGRVRDGLWQSGPKIVHLPQNDGKNHIHGGTGLDTEVYSFKTVIRNDSVQAIFSLFDADQSNAYPGNLLMTVKYTLDNDNRILYEINAIADDVTIFNPTNHVYFRLDGQNRSVADTKLKLDSDYYLPLDKESLPFTGRYSVNETPFDFRQAKKIGAALRSTDPQILAEKGLNHPFMLNGNEMAAQLTASDNLVTMKMATKSPCIVVYTGNHFNNTGITSNIGQYDGVTLEAQFPPVTGHDLSAITLLPNEKFNTWTSWQFVF
ncbi:aldose epimerase family protein [Paucilactobacillus suebicus]|uniref:Aldose 1-epimerase n=1 Tax=Paucilactobacillus suebicus DSM 5007 = KCTC 3549 TaxID=1423807 RepID=A0A0R1W8T0_9LACO|nr:aldose epimerase family protein [Paucilactobacillus suebicus]KRM12283.1 aldose 1-epimerase [Paucilactobacillus suebicus DSM 5007 = KCTC 3549]